MNVTCSSTRKKIIKNEILSQKLVCSIFQMKRLGFKCFALWFWNDVLAWELMRDKFTFSKTRQVSTLCSTSYKSLQYKKFGAESFVNKSLSLWRNRKIKEEVIMKFETGFVSTREMNLLSPSYFLEELLHDVNYTCETIKNKRLEKLWQRRELQFLCILRFFAKTNQHECV